MHVPLTPLRCLLRALQLYPDKVGVVSGEMSYTYAQFADRCCRMAAGLLVAGCKPGDRIGFLSFNTNVLLEGYFAAPLAACIVLPLNVRLHCSELAVILQHAKPRILFYDPEFGALIRDLKPIDPTCSFIPIGESDAEYSLHSLMAVDPLALPDMMSIDENAIAEIFYTSGSTGSPKGVMLSHRSLYLHALSLAGSLDHSDRQVVLHTIPLFHANGWGFPQFATMCGFKQVMVRRFEPSGVFRLIEKERATIMILVPTMAAALIHCPDRAKFDLSSLDYVILGGAASSPELIALLEMLLPGCTVFAGYGLTETSPVISTARKKSTLTFSSDAERQRFASSAGWSFLGVDVRVVDSHGEDVPQDARSAGEIIVRGDNVMDGYYLDPALTSDSIVNGWLHTGDMAVWDKQRCLQIIDRKKDIIISGGENIASIEVEHAIQAYPDVAECAVIAAPHPRWGEAPVAIVVLKENSSATAEQLLEFASKRIAKFKLPQRILFRQEALPKGGTGKVLKYELREQFWSGIEKRVQG